MDPTKPQAPVTSIFKRLAVVFSFPPTFHELTDSFPERYADVPRRIVFAEFSEVAVVADVVADAVFLRVSVLLRLS